MPALAKMKSPAKKLELDLSKYTLKLSQHAQRMATEKGFTKEIVESTFRNPTRVYPSGSHPGQWRITGNGLCLVGVPDRDRRSPRFHPYMMQPPIEHELFFTVVTLYQDQILTPPRDDQLNTPEGRRYAERYLKGEGRG
jgi:hypothetical protein